MPETPILMRRQGDYVNVLHRRLPGWTKRDIRAFLRAQAGAIEACLNQEGARPWDRAVIIPGVVKVYAKLVEAKPERRARNPATGVLMRLPAEPKHMKARVKALARVKRAAGQVVVKRESKLAGPPAVLTPKRKSRYEREPVI